MSNKKSQSINPIANVKRALEGGKEIEFRIMAIIAVAAAIANTIGFIANFLLYGMNFPTAFCGFCDLLAILYLCFGLNPKSYKAFGGILLIILIVFEFPLLLVTYGAVMTPYMVLGFVTVVMIKRKKLFVILLGIYDVAVIVFQVFFSNLTYFSNFSTTIYYGTDLLGSAVITFAVSISAVAVCILMWQNVYIDATRESDNVTGVYSRFGFEKNATRIIEEFSDKKLCILFFDVRSFKAVNNIYGIDGGNQLLKQVAMRLAHSSIKPLAIGRSSADHFFCICLEEDVDSDDLSKICKYKFSLNGKTMALNLNCGVYEITDRSISVQSMCDRAQMVTKFIHDGNNKYVAFYNDKIEEAFIEETNILGEVEQAIITETFEPYYQPIVDCQTGKIVSAEALARWNHPEKGVISPAVFIPVLEEKELISDLDAIIAKKVNNLMEQRDRAEEFMVPISINLSRVDFYDSEMINKLQEMVKESRFGGKWHRFEVTESTYETLTKNVVDVLAEFRQLGAQILVDDFGSGYSSLGMITDYEFDIIKLDLKFAVKIDENEKIKGVIHSIIELAHYLDAKVVAEGVETETQLNFLKEQGCDYVQGYYFYKPMCEKDFIELLDQQ